MQKLIFALATLALTSLVSAHAATGEQSCYAGIKYGPKINHSAKRALYILVDQTTPLSTRMQKHVSEMVDEWGQPGDQVKIVMFSANFRDRYPDLVFSGRVDTKPTDEYLYNLRWTDKEQLTQCLEEQQAQFRKGFSNGLASALRGMDPEIPKTDLLHSLKQIARQVISTDETEKKTVLLVSDGIENSTVVSFYRNGQLGMFDRKRAFAKARRSGLIPDWHNATVYLYGLALPTDGKRYANPSSVDNLRLFWERYFVEGNANVAAIGTPELLISAIE